MIGATLLSLIPFYLIGSIPTGQLIARSKGVDLTKQGSGNVGATNALRVLGKWAGILTLLGDCLKGMLAIQIARVVNNSPDYLALVAFATVAGHCLSIPGVLKGGKGVATSFGVMAALLPTEALGALGIFVLVFVLSKMVSLSSISAMLAIPVLAMIGAGPEEYLYASGCISLLVVFRHKENLQRITEGKEPKFDLSIKK